ncbi:MAG: PilZ domain-containing protein [Acidobacteriota bacterium]
MREVTRERRTVQRLRFAQALKGLVRARKVRVLDLSVAGACIEHSFAMSRGSRIRLQIEWDQKEITLPAHVTRCGLMGYTEGVKGIPIYQSGLEFENADPMAIASLKEVVDAHVTLALQEGRSFADGTLPAKVGNVPLMVWLMNKLK